MTIELITRAAVSLFKKEASPTKFLSDMFVAKPPINQEKIPIDIMRGEERVAVDVVPGTGPDGQKKLQPFTAKEYVTPAYDESYIMSASETKQRLAGNNAFEPADINAALTAFIADSMKDGQDRIDRAVERQAAEVFNEGTITFQNNDSLDFKMKATHKVTVGTLWSNIAANALGDIQDIGDEIRKDGLGAPNTLIFGSEALRDFLALTEIKDQLNLRRAKLIDIVQPRPNSSEKGATFHGLISIGSYEYQIWAYPQWYVSSADGVSPIVKTEYMPTRNVIVMDSRARLERHFGGIHRFADGNLEGAQAAGISGIMNTGTPTESAPYVFMGNRGLAMEIGVRSRPLCIPIDLDSFARLTV